MMVIHPFVKGNEIFVREFLLISYMIGIFLSYQYIDNMIRIVLSNKMSNDFL